jgi:hypothetical protein
MVPVTKTYNGNTLVVMQPTRSELRAEKKGGERFQGTRSEMYLLYREPKSGIAVYFLDSIARQNFDNVVIAVPSAPSVSSAPVPATPPTKTAETDSNKQAGNGVLSDELLAWYLKLQAARQSLDINDQAAVVKFNEQAAQYQDALKKARDAKKAQ